MLTAKTICKARHSNINFRNLLNIWVEQYSVGSNYEQYAKITDWAYNILVQYRVHCEPTLPLIRYKAIVDLSNEDQNLLNDNFKAILDARHKANSQ